VAHAPELDGDLLLSEREDLELRADPLRRGAERVAVLAEQAGVGVEVDLGVLVDGELARLKRRADVGGRLDLAGVRARDVVDELVELRCQIARGRIGAPSRSCRPSPRRSSQ